MKRIITFSILLVLVLFITSTSQAQIINIPAGFQEDEIEIVISLKNEALAEVPKIVACQIEIQHSENLTMADKPENYGPSDNFKVRDGWMAVKNQVPVEDCERIRKDSLFPMKEVEKGMRFILIAMASISPLESGEEICRIKFFPKNPQSSKIAVSWILFNTKEFSIPSEVIKLTTYPEIPRTISINQTENNACLAWGLIKQNG